jgi:hypothetical protein
MRDELKRITESDYWVYGLNEEDFAYTLGLAHELIEARQNELERQKQQVEIVSEGPDPVDEESLKEALDEVISDMAYYTYIDIQYVWHFCLWRLQAIFEGLITYAFLPAKPTKPLMGLKAKLDAMRAAGYSINQQDYDELIAWAKLRNSLSHAPPEQYRPGPLDEQDAIEYKEFVESICCKWRIEEGAIKHP